MLWKITKEFRLFAFKKKAQSDNPDLMLIADNNWMLTDNAVLLSKDIIVSTLNLVL